MTQEQRQNVEKWIAALRSGEYKQGIFGLRRNDCFCCLGVACDLIDPTKWETSYDDIFSYCEDSTLLSSEVMSIYGMNTRDGAFNEGFDCLSAKNDRGASFSEIADTIESELNNPETTLFVR